MCRLVLDLLIITVAGSAAQSTIAPEDWIGRERWSARPPVVIETMRNPVPYVVIHHSYTPSACSTTDECIEAMQTMQDMHQLTNGWYDIGYHFAVGGDGKIYEGRGWSRVGAHSPGYNNISIGICVIGDWRFHRPPTAQLDAVKSLIGAGVTNGLISNDYKLYGHRQVRETECPGDELFNEIKTWNHFSKGPRDGNGGVEVKNVAAGAENHKLFFFKHKS